MSQSIRSTHPHPTDVCVGIRIRIRRKELKYSQTDLAEALGLTFQQVQKYERGANRISASMLFKTASFFGVAIGYFFEEVAGGPLGTASSPPELSAFLNSADGAALAGSYLGIRNPNVRRQILALVTDLSQPGPRQGVIAPRETPAPPAPEPAATRK